MRLPPPAPRPPGTHAAGLRPDGTRAPATPTPGAQRSDARTGRMGPCATRRPDASARDAPLGVRRAGWRRAVFRADSATFIGPCIIARTGGEISGVSRRSGYRRPGDGGLAPACVRCAVGRRRIGGAGTASPPGPRDVDRGCGLRYAASCGAAGAWDRGAGAGHSGGTRCGIVWTGMPRNLLACRPRVTGSDEPPRALAGMPLFSGS